MIYSNTQRTIYCREKVTENACIRSNDSLTIYKSISATSGRYNGQSRQVTGLHVQEDAAIAKTEKRTETTQVKLMLAHKIL